MLRNAALVLGVVLVPAALAGCCRCCGPRVLTDGPDPLTRIGQAYVREMYAPDDACPTSEPVCAGRRARPHVAARLAARVEQAHQAHAAAHVEVEGPGSFQFHPVPTCPVFGPRLSGRQAGELQFGPAFEVSPMGTGLEQAPTTLPPPGASTQSAAANSSPSRRAAWPKAAK